MAMFLGNFSLQLAGAQRLLKRRSGGYTVLDDFRSRFPAGKSRTGKGIVVPASQQKRAYLLSWPTHHPAPDQLGMSNAGEKCVRAQPTFLNLSVRAAKRSLRPNQEKYGGSQRRRSPTSAFWTSEECRRESAIHGCGQMRISADPIIR